MYYLITTSAVTTSIHQVYPKGSFTVARENLDSGREPTIGHICWMCGEIQRFDTADIDAALKAARWVGWVLRWMESQNFWSNATSKELIKADKFFRLHAPHGH